MDPTATTAQTDGPAAGDSGGGGGGGRHLMAEQGSAATGGGQAAIDPAAIAPGVEAVLLTSDRPVSPARLLEALGLGVPTEEQGKLKRGKKKGGSAAEGTDAEAEGAEGKADAAAGRRDGRAALAAAVGRLNEDYERTGRSFRIEQVAGGYRVMTLPKFAGVVAAFQGSRMRSNLSHAALETMAIIAYKQPVTRAQLEAIRGVACGEVLRSLIDRRLVTIAGRAEELGRPLLYGTTKQFLETFGLSSIKDLPSVEELRARVTGQSED
jgi:segregation and condensation protein B